MSTPSENDLIDLILPEAEIVRRIIEEVQQHPRIRRPLLRFLMADDFDELIAAVRENSDNIRLILERIGVVEQAVQRIPAIEEAVQRIPVIEERLASVEEAVQRIPVIEERLASVEEAVQRIPVIEERLTSVEEAVQRIPAIEEAVQRIPAIEEAVQRIPAIEEAVQRTDRVVRSLQGSVGQLRGDSYELKCAEQIDAVLDGHLSSAVLADRERVNTLLRNARRTGLISRAELQDGYNVDIIARPYDDADGTDILAVVEASVTFNRQDLETVTRRAALIGRITGVVTASYLVTHHDWPTDMDTTARELGVTIVQYALPQYATDT